MVVTKKSNSVNWGCVCGSCYWVACGVSAVEWEEGGLVLSILHFE